MARVIICLPTRNGESHIQEALESLICQTMKDIKIVVFDNASTDRTREIVKKLQVTAPNLHYFHSHEFLPANGNWSRAFIKAKEFDGEYFMWAGDDDKWEPDYIETLVTELNLRTDHVLIFSNYTRINESGEDVEAKGCGERAWANYSKMKWYKWLRAQGPAGYSAIYGVMRLRAIDWSPAMEDATIGSDLWFLIKLGCKGKVCYTPKRLFRKRTGGLSVTGEDESASKDEKNIWNIDVTLWRQIQKLSLTTIDKHLMFNSLKIYAKLMFPTKPLSLSLWAIFAIQMVLVNPYGLGIRSNLSRRHSRIDPR
jgi:glycosyltransferase involved in cell wall biosynthesis